MNKKGLTIVITALVLGVFVFGMAGGVFAQTDDTPEVEATEESLTAPVVTRKAYGRGNQNRQEISLEEGDMQYGFGPGDGTCDGEALGFGPGDGTCDGEPIQQRLQDGTGAGSQYGMGQGAGLGQGLGAGGVGTGQGQAAGTGFGAGRGAGGNGAGAGPGQGLGDGLGLHDGSCIND